MSLFERIPDPANQALAYPPLFNLIGNYSRVTRHIQVPSSTTQSSAIGEWHPSFDVTENHATYELHGELPGIDMHDLHVEFSARDTLTISGHKKRRDSNTNITTKRASVDGRSRQRRLSTVSAISLDSATIGPGRNDRRTSIVDASETRNTPSENIDGATTITPHERSKRRDSVIDAQSRQQPADTLDAWAHRSASSAGRDQNTTIRRSSIVDAQTRHSPAENIDAWAHATRLAEHSQNRRSSILDAANWQRPTENIDAATTCVPRRSSNGNGNAAARPSSPLRTSSVSGDGNEATDADAEDDVNAAGRRGSSPSPSPTQQPWLVNERRSGAFSRVFRFPDAVSREGVKACLRDGVLTVVVPKAGRGEDTVMGSGAGDGVAVEVK